MRRVLMGILAVLAVSTVAWGSVLPPPADGKKCDSQCGTKASKNMASSCGQTCAEPPRRVRLHEAEVPVIASDDDACGKCTKDCPSAKKAGQCDKSCAQGKEGGKCAQAGEPRRVGGCGDACGKDCPKKAKGGPGESGVAGMKIMKLIQGEPGEAECEIIIECEELGQFLPDGRCGEDCRGDCSKKKNQGGKSCSAGCEMGGKGDRQGGRPCAGDCGGGDRGRDCSKKAKGGCGKGCSAGSENAGKCDPRRDCRRDGSCRGGDRGGDCGKASKCSGDCRDRDGGRDRGCCPMQRCDDGRSCRAQSSGRGQGACCCCCCGGDWGKDCRSARDCDRPRCGDVGDRGMRCGGWERHERSMMRHRGHGRPRGHGGCGRCD